MNKKNEYLSPYNYNNKNNKKKEENPDINDKNLKLIKELRADLEEKSNLIKQLGNDLKKSDTRVLLMTPQGEKFNQAHAYELAKNSHIIIICGHYEGFDERIRTLADEEIRKEEEIHRLIFSFDHLLLFLAFLI